MYPKVNRSPNSSKISTSVLFQSSVIIFLVTIDQLAKNLFIHCLQKVPNSTFKINQFINIVYRWNYGISFGFFNQYRYSNLTFSILNSFIIAYLCYLLTHNKSLKGYYAKILILGGAMGNLMDRFFKGAVFDFIDLHYLDYHFPVFNLADSFITIGATMLIYHSYIAIGHKL